jgi:antitoxin component YwqK of YwqJK toxin-antitoxin module
MKKLLSVLVVALLLAGCGGKTAKVGKIGLDDPETRKKIIAETINDKKLQRRGQEGEALHYARNQQTPYTGWAKGMRKNGQIRRLDQYKDGKKDGLVQVWYENRQKRSEAKWKDGKMVTIVVWKPNGEKCPVTKVVNGNGVRTWYNDDGTESFRTTYKDGVKVD